MQVSAHYLFGMACVEIQGAVISAAKKTWYGNIEAPMFRKASGLAA